MEFVTNCHELNPEIAGNARQQLEQRLKRPVVSSANYLKTPENKKLK